MMLPVTSGFIFPNGIILESNGSGHRKTAAEFIRKNGLREKYREYERKTSGGEDEYLTYALGAVKACHYCGVHYLYVPRVHNDYIESIVKKYKDEEYTIKILDSCMSLDVKVQKVQTSDDGYGRTVTSRKDVNGMTYYIYNPNRVGD